MQSVVITFDVGTQSLRGMIVDKKGNLLAFEREMYEAPYFSQFPTWAEQKPNFYYESLCRVSRKLKENNKELFESAIAVTVTVFRDTTLCLDKNNKPLRDIVMWLDKRETKNSKKLSPLQTVAFKAVGMLDVIKSQQKMASCNWVQENQPEIWEKTAKFVLLPTYLNYQLTGNLIDSNANIIGHVPIDYKNKRWQPKGALTRCLADIPMEKLVPIVNPGDTIGHITEQTSIDSGIKQGLPLIATGADKSCETLGLSVTDTTKAAISYGTAATIQVVSKKYIEVPKFAPTYPSVMGDRFNVELQIYRGYWMLTWFKNNFVQKEAQQAEELGVSVETILNSKLKDIPAGSNGLLLQALWGPGVITPNVKGAIIGFSDVHTKMHIYRAIIEGICFGLMEGMYGMEKKSKTKVKELYVAGGGSQSEEICQITANMFGLPVKRAHDHETCGIGCAMVAFVSLGEFKSYDEAIKNMCHEKDTFYPDMKEHAIYKDIYDNTYSKMLKRLQPLYTSTKKIINKNK
ncbi:MAG: FGGY-family carbohydrate kinase [Bacillota bacterium]